MTGPIRHIFPIVMAAMMSFLMSGAITLIHTGFDSGLVWRWLGAWSLSFPLAAIGVLVVTAPARAVSEAIIAHLPRRYREGL